MIATRFTKLTSSLALLVAVAIATTSSAAIVWTGASDGDITNDLNYDFSGSTLTTVDGIENPSALPGPGVLDDIFYGNAGIAPVLTEINSSQLNYGNSGAFGLTFDNVISTTAGNDGWRGGTISLVNGAQTTSTFFTQSTISIDATSSAILLGGGSPLVAGTTIDMAPGAIFTFTNENLTAFTTEHLGKFTVSGAALTDGLNATVVSDGGSGTIITATAVAVPEPGALAMTGLAWSSMLIRRRRG